MDGWDRIYRENWGELVSRLTRQFGPAHLEVVEAAAQDAFLLAMQSFSEQAPESSLAWLLTTARRRVIDELRRVRTHERKEDELSRHIEVRREAGDVDTASERSAKFSGEVQDDQLHMLFVCSHPAVAEDTRVPLTLKTLCGFELPELARVFLLSEDALAKRLVRARAALREKGMHFDLPDSDELERRLDTVLRVLYLIFNEGYSGHSGEQQIRAELCEEAIRLTVELTRNPATALPRTWALLAMFMLSSARLPARLDQDGALVDLKSQKRELWDRARISAGFEFLQRSAHGPELSGYHLEAMIAACHARASHHNDTDWRQIAELYERLHDLVPSPVILLQRAIAKGYAEGALTGLAEIQALADDKVMKRFYLFSAALGEFAALDGDLVLAEESLRTALTLVHMPLERDAIERKLAAISR
jgi:RNA polymerase sigma-70 factor (ECF subfamily)